MLTDAAVPPEVRALDPAWATCSMNLFGVYDPPTTLHGATLAMPTVNSNISPPSTPANPSSTPAAPTATQTGPASVDSTTDTSLNAGATAASLAGTSSVVQASAVPSSGGQPTTAVEQSESILSTTSSAIGTGIVTSAAESSFATQQDTVADPGPVPTSVPFEPSVEATSTTSSPQLSQSSSAQNDPSSAQPSVASVVLGSHTLAITLVPSSSEDDPAQTAANPASGPASSDAASTNALSILASAATGEPLTESSDLVDPISVSNAPIDPTTRDSHGTVAYPASIKVDSTTLTADSASNYGIGSRTLAPGGSAVTEQGTAYSLVTSASAVVINGQTTPLATASPSPASPEVPVSGAVITVSGNIISAQQTAGSVVVGSSTFSIGQEATISGVKISVGSSAVVLGGSTVTYSTYAIAAQSASEPGLGGGISGPAESIVSIGSQAYTIFAQPSGLEVLANHGTTTTLSVNGPAVSIDGQAVSAAPSGLVIGMGSEATTVAIIQDPGTASNIITIGTQTFSASVQSNGAEILANGATSLTLTLGAPATTIESEAVSAASNGLLVVGSSTITAGRTAPSSGGARTDSSVPVSGASASATQTSGGVRLTPLGLTLVIERVMILLSHVLR